MKEKRKETLDLMSKKMNLPASLQEYANEAKERENDFNNVWNIEIYFDTY